MRTALVGFGPAGAGLHAPLIAAVDGLELSAVVTRDEGRRATVARDHPGAAVLDSVDAVWDGGYDLLVVAAPNRAHAVLARHAIEHGLAVVVDKPLAPTEAVARALVDQAAGAGVPLGAFHNRRWDGDFLAVRDAIATGSLGEVVRLESRWDRWRPEVAAGRWREAADPADAGGLLFDLGSHLIDQALVLFGDPVSVYAELDRRRPGAEVDDDAFVALRFAGGQVAHLSMSMVAASPAPRFRVTGLAGQLESVGLDPQEESLRGDRPAGYAIRIHDGKAARELDAPAGTWPVFYEGVRDAVRGHGPMPVTGEDGVAVLRVIEAARRSAEGRAIVAL